MNVIKVLRDAPLVCVFQKIFYEYRSKDNIGQTMQHRFYLYTHLHLLATHASYQVLLII